MCKRYDSEYRSKDTSGQRPIDIFIGGSLYFTLGHSTPLGFKRCNNLPVDAMVFGQKNFKPNRQPAERSHNGF